METYVKPLNLFFFEVGALYWQVLEKVCPKHVPWKLSTTPIDYGLSNYHGIKIFWPFMLHISTDFFVNPYSLKKSCKFLDNVCPKVLDVSNKPS